MFLYENYNAKRLMKPVLDTNAKCMFETYFELCPVFLPSPWLPFTKTRLC